MRSNTPPIPPAPSRTVEILRRKRFADDASDGRGVIPLLVLKMG
jgi:hypothetical protein